MQLTILEIKLPICLQRAKKIDSKIEAHDTKNDRM